MNRFECKTGVTAEKVTNPLMWFIALLLTALLSSCGGQDVILGGIGLKSVTPQVPPTVTLVSPASAASGIAPNTKAVSATFSNPMDTLTITAANFFVTASGVSVAGAVSAAGASALFTPTASLIANTQYTATIKGAPNGVKDVAGNLMVSDYVWSFTTGATPDVTPPTVTLVVPANAASGVAVNSTVTATFSKPINPATITAANFSVASSGVTITGAVSTFGVNAVFVPSSNLLPSTLYTATVKGAPNGVKDLVGNLLTADYVWSFTTGAVANTTPPTVTLVVPANAASGVAVNSTVSATFSKPMNAATLTTAAMTLQASGPPLGLALSGTVTYDALNDIATFTPQVNLLTGTAYTASVTTLAKDTVGNALAANKVWSFTTAATSAVPPTVNLGTSSTYGTFGGSAGMTNQGTLTVINGNIGTTATATSSITGFHDTPDGDIFTETGANIGLVNGTIYTCTISTTGPNNTIVNAGYCALATQALADGQTAYTALAAMPSNGALAGNLAGTTITPGVYTNATSVMIQGGDLTLDALGNPNALFVFQIGSTLTIGGPGATLPQSIILKGGAQAKNVFWRVGTAATINAAGGGTVVGTIITTSGATFSTVGNVSPVTLNGRVMSLVASVTLVNTIINVPAP